MIPYNSVLDRYCNHADNTQNHGQPLTSCIREPILSQLSYRCHLEPIFPPLGPCVGCGFKGMASKHMSLQLVPVLQQWCLPRCVSKI